MFSKLWSFFPNFQQFPSQVHSLSLVLRKKTNELAKASVSKLFTHMEMIGLYNNLILNRAFLSVGFCLIYV